MYELKVKNSSGEVLNLSATKKYKVYKIDGLTPPAATINSSVNTTQDGSIINSARLENRNIVIYMTIEGNAEENRINLYKYFTPKRNVSIYFKNNIRNVYIEGTVELIETDLFAQKQLAQVSIICPKPYFRSINDLVSVFSEVSSYFSFPFAIPVTGIELSSVTTNIRKSIINSGDVETGIIIKLFTTGTVVNPILYDVNKRTALKLNITMQAGDTIIINTNTGEKSIQLLRSGAYSNAMGYLTPDSNWLTLTAGDNVFAYECESGSSNLQITFSTSILYGGV